MPSSKVNILNVKQILTIVISRYRGSKRDFLRISLTIIALLYYNFYTSYIFVLWIHINLDNINTMEATERDHSSILQRLWLRIIDITMICWKISQIVRRCQCKNKPFQKAVFLNSFTNLHMANAGWPIYCATYSTNLRAYFHPLYYNSVFSL